MSTKPDDKPELDFTRFADVKHKFSKENLDKTESEAPQLEKTDSDNRMLDGVESAAGGGSKIPELAHLKKRPGSNADNGVAAALGKAVKGFTGKDPLTFAEQRARQGAKPNITENLSPLGSSGILKDLLSELIQNVGGEATANNVESVQELGTRIDRIRMSIRTVVGDATDLARDLEPKVQIIEAKTTGNDPREERLDRFLAEALSGTESRVSFPGPSVDVGEQLRELKSFHFSLAGVCRSLVLSSSFDDQGRAILVQIKDRSQSIAERAGDVLSQDLDIVPHMLEDIRQLDPTLGDFVARGTNQELDAGSYHQDRTGGVASGGNSLANHPVFKNFRRSYLKNGHPSVPKLSTDFGNKLPFERDTLEQADERVSTQTQAAPADGVGDKGQQDESLETTPGYTEKGPVGPLDESRWSTYTDTLGQRESGNDYKKVNTIGFCGRWQFGGPALADFGYVRPGTSTRSLRNNSVWTGKNGINSRDDFLANTGKVQDKLIVDYTRRNYKSLRRMSVLKGTDEPPHAAGMMAAAHLKGPGGARKFANGKDNSDAYGTKASEYYSLLKGAVAGGVPSNESTTAVASNGGSAGEQTAAFVDSTTLSDAPQVAMPTSDSAAVRNPYNAVRSYEGGHFKEYDSSPGAERIQERHRTGTGYEVDPSGQYKQVVVGDSYRAVMGSDFIMVQGHCQIVVQGDVGIKSDGNININSGQDLNMLVGGDFNLRVAGSKNDYTTGSSMESVDGDKTSQVSGFRKDGTDGDYQTEAASINAMARNGQVNVAAAENMNLFAVGKTHVLGKGGMRTTTGGDYKTSVGGNMVAEADQGMAIKSKGDTVIAAKGNMGVKSDGAMTAEATSMTHHAGSMALRSGSTIQTEPQVNTAQYTKVARVLGGTPNVPAASTPPVA